MQTRRSFLTNLFKDLVVASVTPQIVTHGLKLKKPYNKLVTANELYWNGEVVLHHDFLSPELHFIPTFQDFLNTLPEAELGNLKTPRRNIIPIIHRVKHPMLNAT